MRELIERIEGLSEAKGDDYKIVPDKKFNDQDLEYKGHKLRRWNIKKGSKTHYRIDDESGGFRAVVTFGKGADSLSHGPFPKFDLAVAKIAALIDGTVNAFGEKFDVTPKKKGGEWAVIEVNPK